MRARRRLRGEGSSIVATWSGSVAWWMSGSRAAVSARPRRVNGSLEQEHRARENRGPALCGNHGGLGDVEGTDDLSGDLEHLLFLVPVRGLVELDAERRGEHRGRHVLGEIPGELVGLTV